MAAKKKKSGGVPADWLAHGPPPWWQAPAAPPAPSSCGCTCSHCKKGEEAPATPSPASASQGLDGIEALIQSPLSLLGGLFPLDEKEFWKGAVLGAAAIFLWNNRQSTPSAPQAPMGDQAL